MTPAEVKHPLVDQPWKAGGICDCTSDLRICCKTIFLPCVVFGETREVLHGGEIPKGQWRPSLTCCLVSVLTATLCTWIYTMQTRSDIRSKYNLPPEPCHDCCVHFLCWPLALCQERRELKQRPTTTWP